ncbi:toll/interleukin-1 receptor domain-containing protein [Sinorhizobium sp. 22678]|uniref:toll/interleukin-1 receptor domain-containing protein n=1 Tax=Sinorhizobium sp. 22678 TaxID=3453955 RepID=UPI003F85443A
MRYVIATFDVFISYSGRQPHRAIAEAIESGLRRFARPWYKISALRVFRDTTNLAANPDLWGSIKEALSRSRSLVYLASPEAAASRWVRRELNWWLDHRGPEKLIFVILAGKIAPTDDHQRLDPAATDCIPREILERLNSLPLYVDLRGLAENDPVDLQLPVFTSGLAQVAAAVRGVSLDQITGEAVRQRRHRNRAVAAAVVLVSGLIAGATLGFYLYRLSAREAAATALWNKLQFSTVELRPGETDALWTIAASDPPLFQEFWSQLKRDSNIRKVGARTELIARTAGLGKSPKAKVSVDSIVETIRAPLDPDQVRGLATVARKVPLQIDEEQASIVLDAILKAMRAPTDKRDSLVDLFTVFAPRLPPERAVALFDSIPIELEFRRAITALGPKLTPQQAAKYVASTTTALQQPVDPSQWHGHLNVVAALAPRLAPDEAASTMASLLEAIEAQTDSRRRVELSRLLEGLSSRLRSDEARIAREALLSALQVATDIDENLAIVRALTGLPEQMGPSTTEVVLSRLFAAVESNDEAHHDDRPARLAQLMDAIGSLPVKLTPEQATNIFDSFVSALRVARLDRDSERLALGRAVQSVALRLKSSEVPNILDRLIEALQDETQEIQEEPRIKNQLSAPRLSLIVDSILALQTQLSDTQSEMVIDSLLGAVRIDADFAGVIVQLYPRLQPRPAASIVDRLLSVVKVNKEPYDLHALIKTIKELPFKLNSEQETVAFDSLIREIQAASYPHDLAVQAEAMAILDAKPTSRQAEIILERFLPVMETIPNGTASRSLIGGLASLAGALTTEQTSKVLNPRLAAITGADNKQMRVLIEAVGILPTKTTAEQTKVIVDRLLVAIKKIDDFLRKRQAKSDQRFALIEVLKVLASRLSDEQLSKVLIFACENLSRTGDDFEEVYWTLKSNDEFEATHWAEVIDELLHKKSAAQHVTSLIEVLKYPTASGKATKVLLSGLRRRFASAPETLEEAVDWMGARFPELESRFSSPPDRMCGFGAGDGSR